MSVRVICLKVDDGELETLDWLVQYRGHLSRSQVLRRALLDFARAQGFCGGRADCLEYATRSHAPRRPGGRGPRVPMQTPAEIIAAVAAGTDDLTVRGRLLNMVEDLERDTEGRS